LLLGAFVVALELVPAPELLLPGLLAAPWLESELGLGRGLGVAMELVVLLVLLPWLLPYVSLLLPCCLSQPTSASAAPRITKVFFIFIDRLFGLLFPGTH
jgi:hypothetical protein